MSSTKVIYADSNHQPVEKKDAVHMEILEYDDAGKLIKATQGRVDDQGGK